MPSLQDYITALYTDYDFQVDSSQDLIDDVTNAQNKRIASFTAKNKPAPAMKHNLTKVTGYDPHQTLKIKPIELLHAIGRATTPPIPNLVDISATWAILHYMWAFALRTENGTTPLRLSDQARRIDFHQKALLSDQMGIGFACYLMSKWYGLTNPVDVDVALNQLSWNITKQHTKSPDYIFLGSGTNPTVIVECKGTQTSRAVSIDQIRSGTEQLPSIVFNDGRPTTGMIFATCLKQKSTTIYVVDPPDKDLGNVKNNLRETQEQTPWVIEDTENFIEKTNSLNSAKLLSFSGDNSVGLDLVPIEYDKLDYRQNIQPEQKIIRTDFGNFSGISETVDTKENVRIEIFRGLIEERRNQIIAHIKDENISTDTKHVLNKYTSNFRDNPYFINKSQLDQKTSINSYCSDGTLLQIRLSQM